MADLVKGSIYQTDVRVKIACLNESVQTLSEKRNFSAAETQRFFPAALFAAIYATEQKDDEGSVFISFKFPEEQKAYTAVCETDGRLRGYTEPFTPNQALGNNILFVSGIRLALRGDYQSAVSAKDVPSAIADFYKNSRQTKADFSLFSYRGHHLLILAEYLPGHDVNYRDESKKLSEEAIFQKLKEAVGQAEKTAKQALDAAAITRQTTEDLFLLPITFGCTCSKRKIKQALLTSGEQDLTFPLFANCKLCGKEYRIESL